VSRTVTVEERRARLAARHLMLPDHRPDDPVEVCDALVALHSTDPVSVHLSAALRTREPSIGAVEQALYDDRTLVRHHAMRRTLWVATPEVLRVLHAAVTRRIAESEERRLEKFLRDNGEADPARWLQHARDEVATLLRDSGPLPARAVGERLPDLRRPLTLGIGTRWETTVAAHSRVLLQLGFEAAVLRARPVGTWVSGQYTWADAETWLPGGVESDLAEDEACAELAERWLGRFGPATTADLQWWTGWTLTRTRRALADCHAVEVATDEGPAWVAAGDEPPETDGGRWVALLPALDPTVMGWKQRSWYLPAACRAVFDRAGNAGPTVWADGQVVGAWSRDADGGVVVRMLVDVPRRVARAVADEAERVRALVGDVRFTIRFPNDLHRELSG
jgi:hypothetical protein